MYTRSHDCNDHMITKSQWWHSQHTSLTVGNSCSIPCSGWTDSSAIKWDAWIHIYICTNGICLYVCIYVYIIYTYIRTCININACTLLYMYIHTYACMYIHNICDYVSEHKPA